MNTIVDVHMDHTVIVENTFRLLNHKKYKLRNAKNNNNNQNV